jgi:hypothetical protein
LATATQARQATLLPISPPHTVAGATS